MENLSHSRPPSKASHASVAKRGCNGGKFAGKTVYEDVFGGPPKFGVPTLSPRPEDYSEIFGGFHASRATSIPVLDLPLVDEDEVFFDVRGCGFDYREVFGGVDGLDFATSFEELIREANGGGDPHDCDGDVEGDSSEEAWTPVETESLSGESDRSGQNQQSSNGDSYEPIDSSLEFSISYHRANHQSNGSLSNGVTRIAEPHLPEYTCVVDNSRPVKKTEIKNLPVYVCDDGSLDFTGRTMQEKHLQKAVSNPAKRIADPRPFGDSFELHRSYGKVSSPDDEMFVTISEISLRTHPSEVPPPRRPPPFLNGKSKDYENSQTTGSGGTSGNSSPPYFDVEIDAGSAAAASAAAMEEAMEKARAKMKSAKERMERKREGCPNGIKLGSKRDAKEKREKSTKVVDGSNNAKDERMLGTSRKEDIAMKPPIHQEGQEVTKTTEAVSNPLEREKPFSMAKMSAEEKRGKQSVPSQGTDKTNLVDEWQEATQFFELVRTDDSKMAFVKENNYSFSIDFENTKRKEHQLNAEKATEEALQQQENNQCREEAVREDHELDKVLKNLRTAKEACERGGNTARSEAAKGVHKRKEHEKKVKVAQAGGKPEENEVKSRIIQPSENGKKSARVEGSQKFDKQVIGKQEENEVKSRNIQPSDNVKKSARVEGSQKLEKQVIGKQEENEVKSRIVQPSENGKKSVWEEGSQKLEKQVNGKQEENEVKSRIDQPPENGKNSARVEGSPKLELVYDQEFQIKSEVQLAVNDKKLEQKERETSINMENQERRKECQETEDGESRQREVSERDENDINIGLCGEQTDDVKSMEGAHGQEDREDNSLLQTSELEDNGKKEEEADELDEGEMIWRMALEQLEKETRRKQALEQEETQQKERKTYAKEESEKVSEQLLEQANNEKMQKGVFETEVIAKRVERKRWNQEKDGTKKLLEEAFELEESRRAFKDAWDGKDEMQREHSMEKKECEELREVNEVLWQTEDETGGEVLIDAGAHQHTECEDQLVSDEVNRLDSHVKHEFSRTDEIFDDQEEVREPISVEDSRSVEDEDTDCESLEAKEEENLHWKFGFSGMNQDELEHAASNLRTEEVTRLDHLDDGVKKTDEAGISIGHRNAETIKRFSRTESDNEKHGMAERAENANEIKAASKPEEDKDRFVSPPVVKESAETGRKIEAVKSTLLGARGDTLRTAQPSKTNQNTEKKDKDANLTAREKEFERLKRERELEIERLGKMEEERDREREREKDRMGVDRVTLEARETAYAEVRERAERAALERATAEARQRATAEARERLEKASVEARLRAERAAVERATTEARERAFEKARAERAAFEARQRIERSVSDKFSTFSRNSGMGTSSSSSDLQNQQYKTTGSFNDSRNTSDYNGVEGESAQRCKARLERYRRTAERAAKALAEKNTRDLLAQREQAERNRLAETLDADVRRWSSGKEGNLRALLSTLQYILGSDSGWQPVPLTEVITSAAVKKAYRKATLCVHPDKLQQRGASIHQKYICEKVFDLLKEAWNKFNSEER